MCSNRQKRRKGCSIQKSEVIMNDESIDINISFINTDYFSVSVRNGYISVIGRITKLEIENFVKAHYFEIKDVLDKNVKKGVEND